MINGENYILIHTSVKLVTRRRHRRARSLRHFNPHEREARDQSVAGGLATETMILIHTSVKLVTEFFGCTIDDLVILIHTSVKLVTAA